MAKEAATKAPADESPAAPDLRKQIDEWFFDHFNQQLVLNHPDVYERAQAAKEDLLKLLGIN